MRKCVWITGAGSGIGAAMARAFAGEGFAVALTARGREALDSVAATLPPETPALIEPGDVTDRAAMKAAASRIAEWGGGLHILCDNAGLNIPLRRWADLDDESRESWDRVFAVNVSGALNVIEACLPIMRAQQDGVMIHTSSWAGRHHAPVAGAAYGASKHALSELSASINSEEGANGVRSTAICPGEVATPLLAKRPNFDAARLAHMIQPEDVAALAISVARMNPNVAVHEITLAPTRRANS